MRMARLAEQCSKPRKHRLAVEASRGWLRTAPSAASAAARRSWPPRPAPDWGSGTAGRAPASTGVRYGLSACDLRWSRGRIGDDVRGLLTTKRRPGRQNVHREARLGDHAAVRHREGDSDDVLCVGG